MAYWPADTDAALIDVPFGAVLRRVAATVGDRAAVIEYGPDGTLTSMSYAALLTAAERAARHLLSVAEPGERIAIWAPNSADWVVVEYAAALAGLVLVPLNPALTDSEVADLLERSNCVVLFTVIDYRGGRLLDRATALTGPHIRRVFNLASFRAQCVPSMIDLPGVSPDSPFLVQYTSGTTGAPKGAVLTHRAVVNIGALAGELLELGDGPVWCNPMPLHHVGGSVCVLLPALVHAGTVVLLPDFNPADVLDALERTNATVMGAVPTMVLALLDHSSFADRDVSALRLMQIGGSTVAPALVRRAEDAFGARIVNAYGQSEAPCTAQTRLGDSDEVKALTIGRLGQHREARIVRPGTGGTVGFGEAGELAIRSPLTMIAYLDDPAQTATVFDEDGWLHTGDLCSMTPDGNISVHGRIRDVIICAGENIYPPEIENVLLGHPAISDVAVVGVPDERWGEQVGAAVRFRPGVAPEWTELEAYARKSLAGFKVPRVWRSVEKLPTTASGKIQKFRLREGFRD